MASACSSSEASPGDNNNELEEDEGGIDVPQDFEPGASRTGMLVTTNSYDEIEEELETETTVLRPEKRPQRQKSSTISEIEESLLRTADGASEEGLEEGVSNVEKVVIKCEPEELVTSEDVFTPEMILSTSPSDDVEDDVQTAEWKSKKKHVFILSEAGKPIYSRFFADSSSSPTRKIPIDLSNRKKPKFSYSEETMKYALIAVENGMNLSEASRKFGVPRSTLNIKATGKSPLERRMGPQTVLSKEHEKLLENWAARMAKAGFPIVKRDFLASVERIVRDMGIKNPFTNGRPGRKWLSLFFKRHPAISKVVQPEKRSGSNASKESDVRDWFQGVQSFLKDCGHLNVLKDPKRLFNADELIFMLCPEAEKVLGIRKTKNVNDVMGKNEKESLTVLITANAAGVVAPTLLVFPYMGCAEEITKTVPEEWVFGTADKGWLNGETFYGYITNVFHPWLVAEQIPLPVILFLDGQSNHLTLHMTQFALENGIILLALYPSNTHALHPLNLTVFHPLRNRWQKTLQAWKVDGVRQLTKYNFVPLIHETLMNYLRKDVLSDGFKMCGIHPFDQASESVVSDANESYGKRTELEQLCPLKLSVSCPNGTLQTSVTCSKGNLKTNESVVTTITCSAYTPGNSPMSHVKYLESKLDSETIASFSRNFKSDAPTVWHGQATYTELYHVWRKFKVDDERSSRSETFEHNTIFTEPSPKKQKPMRLTTFGVSSKLS